jgi:hypothetical protein
MKNRFTKIKHVVWTDIWYLGKVLSQHIPYQNIVHELIENGDDTKSYSWQRELPGSIGYSFRTYEAVS